ncbi:YkvA family protein [Fervidobacterium thailandense]|uniref:DUF1232 domain-containing protein n=1 Tax=Fervidobacterium thailandense TaxID=1008305 RepID=A0A1E3G0S3_9BACT|nr:YkvA family protein [Fervidobacterium thailandense]ODN29827.1 hypothetical protein A4H02_08725 [Fervidobacterium thailandense]
MRFERRDRDNAKRRFYQLQEGVDPLTDGRFVISEEQTILRLLENFPFGEVVRTVLAFVSMLKDYFDGRYKEVPLGTITAIIAAMLYFLMPMDVIPDLIPFVGWIDDAFVIRFCFELVRSDVERYLEQKENFM